VILCVCIASIVVVVLAHQLEARRLVIQKIKLRYSEKFCIIFAYPFMFTFTP